MPAEGTTGVGSLRSTIESARRAGHLLVATEPVDPNLELAGLQKRLDGGPPLLFEQVRGYPHARFLVNLFGSRARIDELFGFGGPRDRTRRLAAALRRPLPPRLVGRRQAPVQEVVVTDDLDVRRLIPPIRHTEAEEEATWGSGVSLLAGTAFDGGSHVGYNRLNFRWGSVGTLQVAPGSHLWMAMSRAYRRERIPITINFGLPPAVTLAAGAGFDYAVLPFGCDELGVAGAIQQAPVELVPAVTVAGAFSVAGAEYAIEGWLDPADRRYETRQAEEAREQGRFPFHPEWAGYMGRAYRAPTLHVTAITHRRLETRPLLQPMIVHCAEENAIQTAVREAAFLDLAERILPGFVRDVHIPFALTDWGGAIFQVRKSNPVDEGYQRNVLVGALATSRGMRLALAVDEDVDIYDMNEVLWALTTRVDPQTDVWSPLPGAAGQTFQPSERATAGAREAKGSNTRFEGGLAIDATVPYGRREPFERPRYPVDRVDPAHWFPAEAIARADAEREGWARLLARRGW